ncbi:MAG: hypothetical protein ABI555_04020 [Chloroflexota bacterium]
MATEQTTSDTDSRPWNTTYKDDPAPGPANAGRDASLEDATETVSEANGAVTGDSDGAAASVDTSDSPVATIQTTTNARPANPLMAGLVRAMREAAETARAEVLARTRTEAGDRIQVIQASAETEAADLRSSHDQDVGKIRDWSKAQIARVRDLTDEKVAERKRRLELETEAHTASVERRIEHVQGTVSGFEARMDEFFRSLLAEDDAARLAGFAEQMPEPPALDDEPDDAVGSAWSLDADDAAAAEAEASADLGAINFEVGASAETESDLPRAAIEGDPGIEPVTTTVAVTGLVSVASIAGFKRAVAKTPGVDAISVASGPAGEFIFSVRHEPSIDLSAVISDLSGFSASVTGTADGLLTVTAAEPSA